MNKVELLKLLKSDIGEPNASEDRCIFLSHILDVAEERLKDNGIVFGTTMTIADSALIRDYARFLITDRETQNGLPRYLEYAIRNRIIEQRRTASNA